MIIPDINLLLYAYNPSTPQHPLAHQWWSESCNGDELIGLPLEVAFGFIRIATHQKLGDARVPLAKAKEVVESWMVLPQVRVLTPSGSHFPRVIQLMESAMATGAVLSDAILAAYAIEHRATLWSNDGDFARFKGLNWKNPLLI